MSWKATAEPVLTRMPSVRRPEGHIPFKRKLGWTAAVLVLYFYLTNVHLFGLGSGANDLFGQFRSILAGGQGTVLQLGIGPIVTASIVLQLLSGAELLGLDTDDPRDQVLYQGLQKLLVLAMICLTGIPLVFSGYLPASPVTLAGVSLGTSAVQGLLFAQIFIGGVLVLFMDEIVSKWGVGSGIGLFIVAGVSQKLIGGLLSPNGGVFPTWIGYLTGRVPLGPVFSSGAFQTLVLKQGRLLAMCTTLLIFAIVVYAESVRVEIPLSHSRVKGARGRFPVKLIYASVLPMLLVRALQANIQFIGRLLNSQQMLPEWAGSFSSNGIVTGGILYYLAPIRAPSQWMWWTATVSHPWWQVVIRVGIDLLFMIVGGAIFAIFWVETADMGPEATAKQILNSGMQIPGFRQNQSIIERVMERYIPPITVIGGALVGLLAVLANMLGTIGGVSGTSLLLTVSITYKLYEEIAEEQLMEMSPMLRQVLGG